MGLGRGGCFAGGRAMVHGKATEAMGNSEVLFQEWDRGAGRVGADASPEVGHGPWEGDESHTPLGSVV